MKEIIQVTDYEGEDQYPQGNGQENYTDEVLGAGGVGVFGSGMVAEGILVPKNNNKEGRSPKNEIDKIQARHIGYPVIEMFMKGAA